MRNKWKRRFRTEHIAWPSKKHIDRVKENMDTWSTTKVWVDELLNFFISLVKFCLYVQWELKEGPKTSYVYTMIWERPKSTRKFHKIKDGAK